MAHWNIFKKKKGKDQSKEHLQQVLLNPPPMPSQSRLQEPPPLHYWSRQDNHQIMRYTWPNTIETIEPYSNLPEDALRLSKF